MPFPEHPSGDSSPEEVPIAHDEDVPRDVQHDDDEDSGLPRNSLPANKKRISAKLQK